MKLELRQAAHWCGAELEGARAGSVAAGYSIDSRTIASGELFIAIKGERFDGHDFLSDAFARGAVGAIVARDRLASAKKNSGAKPLLVVDDTLKALQRLASTARKHWGKRVIGITGSAGKTTTKEAVA